MIAYLPQNVLAKYVEGTRGWWVDWNVGDGRGPFRYFDVGRNRFVADRVLIRVHREKYERVGDDGQ